jgi:hypothetical protein
VQPPDASTKLKARLCGAGLLACGLLLLKIGVVDVLDVARSGSASVTTYTKAVIIVPTFVLVGLVLLVIGAPSEPRPGSWALHFVTGHGPQSRLKPLGYVIVVVLIGLGLGLYQWVQSELAALGYE